VFCGNLFSSPSSPSTKTEYFFAFFPISILHLDVSQTPTLHRAKILKALKATVKKK
jgi:hypothetical protein